jgi:uncharacterized damage-inducible protein DinB
MLDMGRTHVRYALGIIAAGALLCVPGWSQTSKAAEATPSVRQEILMVFDSAAQRAAALTEAMPQEKYGWRPMDGVRSFGEVCMHMAGSNFLFLSYVGVKPPSGPAEKLAAAYMKRGFEMPELFAAEAAVTDKAQIIAIMKQSFTQAREFIEQVPEEELSKPVQFFSTKTTVRGVLMLMGGHLSEHFGQAVAYARANRVVPPWSR